MKDYWWKIKIADLLNNPWEIDNITIKNKYLKDVFCDVESPWIECKLFLQSLNHNEILVKIKQIIFSKKYVCDICWNEYTKHYKISDNEEIRFVNKDEYQIKEEIYDTVFPIDTKNKTIDLSLIIEIIVKNQEPIIKNCWKHKNKKETNDIIFQDKNNQENIEFKTLLNYKKNV